MTCKGSPPPLPPSPPLHLQSHSNARFPKKSSVLIFILTILLLAADFYYLKNIAGRRLVGLRWWNEVDTASGNSHWVFESQDRGSTQNLTDKRFFWLALYAQPGLWVGLAIFAIVRFENPIWLSLVGESFNGTPPSADSPLVVTLSC